jgi:DNA helicase II / ATP-dependent DNA helicase PcrA
VLPNGRTLDDQGRCGLEEERRLAHVGLTRARKRAKIYFATTRRMHGLWQTNIPSRFLDELPEANVEVTEAQGGFGGYGGYGGSRFDADTSFGSDYGTPGWQRAQAKRAARGRDGFADEDYSQSDEALDEVGGREREGARTFRSRATRSPARRLPPIIEGELVAKSTGTVSTFALGDRVFHQKFGNGNVVAIDGNKLTIQFDKAGQKHVMDSFVERV